MVFLLEFENQIVNLSGTDGIEASGGLVESRISGSNAKCPRSPTRFCMPPGV